MTPTPVPPTPNRDADGGAAYDDRGHGGHGGWAMLLCCIPMVVAIVLIVLGR